MKYSENYEFSLPNKADNDPADIDILSENFKKIDKILKENENPDVTAQIKEALKQAKESGEFDGADGLSSYEIWLSQGNTGSEADFLESLKGDKGDKGEKGEKGDAYTLTEADKQEIAQNATSVCVAKNQGTANVGKILVVGTDGNLTLTDMPEGGASGDVVGVLDEANNILLSGNLADGTYTLKYENTDGTYTEIGTLEVGAIPEPIEPVTENITLTDGIRIGSDGGDRTQAGCCATPHIDLTNIPKPCTIHLTGARWAFYDTAATGHIMYYAKKTDGSKLAGGYTNDSIGGGYFSLVRNGGGENETDVTVTVTSDEVATIRFGGIWTTVDPNTMQAKATLTYTPNA